MDQDGKYKIFKDFLQEYNISQIKLSQGLSEFTEKFTDRFQTKKYEYEQATTLFMGLKSPSQDIVKIVNHKGLAFILADTENFELLKVFMVKMINQSNPTTLNQNANKSPLKSANKPHQIKPEQVVFVLATKTMQENFRNLKEKNSAIRQKIRTVDVNIDDFSVNSFLSQQLNIKKKNEQLNKFSVIIPLYNNSNYIAQSVLSVLNQSYDNYEIIIIDDCSTDDSYDKANSLRKEYPNKIKLYKNDENIGVYKTLNKGLEYCTGEYITTLGSDDEFHYDRLLEDNIYLQHNNIVISKYVRIDEISKKSLHSPSYGESMITFKKSVLKKLGKWLNCRYGGDTELMDRINMIYGKDYLYRNDKVLYHSLLKKNRENLIVTTNPMDRKKFVEYYKILHSNYNKEISKEDNDKLELLRKQIDMSDEDNNNNLIIFKKNSNLSNYTLVNDFKKNFLKEKIKIYIDDTILDIEESNYFIEFCNINKDIIIVEKTKANIAFMSSNNIELIDYFGKEGKIILTNFKSDYPNCIFCDKYFQEITFLKLYNFYNNKNLQQQIKKSYNNFKNNERREKTIVYVPVWGRHHLLKRCIDSIKNQSEKCLILGVCSNNEDSEFLDSLNVTNIKVLNKPLGLKFQLGAEFCKLFYPKNVIIMGSDDIMSLNYVTNINKHINDYDVVGLRNWRICELENNNEYKEYKVKYNHSIVEKLGKRYWGGVAKSYSILFNIKEYGFSLDRIKKYPFTIGAGRSLGYEMLNKVGWLVYPYHISECLDTNSLFKLLRIENASYITLTSNDYYITSLKDNNETMISQLDNLKKSNDILFE